MMQQRQPMGRPSPMDAFGAFGQGLQQGMGGRQPMGSPWGGGYQMSNPPEQQRLAAMSGGLGNQIAYAGQDYGSGPVRGFNPQMQQMGGFMDQLRQGFDGGGGQGMQMNVLPAYGQAMGGMMDAMRPPAQQNYGARFAQAFGGGPPLERPQQLGSADERMMRGSMNRSRGFDNEMPQLASFQQGFQGGYGGISPAIQQAVQQMQQQRMMQQMMQMQGGGFGGGYGGGGMSPYAGGAQNTWASMFQPQ